MIHVSVDIDELLVTVEALREAIGYRLSWVIRDTPPGLEWEIIRGSLGWLTNAYLNLSNDLRVAIQDTTSGMEWLNKYKIPGPVMNLLNEIHDSESGGFDYHPSHPVLECEICAFLYDLPR